MELNYNYKISEQKWTKNEIDKFLSLFLDFKILPDMVINFDAKNDNTININITLTKEQ